MSDSYLDTDGNLEQRSAERFEASAEGGKAAELLAQADAQELHALYKRKCIELGAVVDSLRIMMQHYSGTSDSPRYTQPESENAVNAMERVALAAIELARVTIERSGATP